MSSSMASSEQMTSLLAWMWTFPQIIGAKGAVPQAEEQNGKDDATAAFLGEEQVAV